MNWVDYTMLAILAVFLLYGFTRGFLRQMLGIIGILAGLFVAWKYAPSLAASDLLAGMRKTNDRLAWIASFMAIFLGIAFISGIAAALLGRFFPKKELKPADSFLGAVLGAVQGILILGGLSIALLDWNNPPIEPVQTSVLAPKLAEGCRALVSLIPEEEQAELHRNMEEAKEKVEGAFPEGKGARPGAGAPPAGTTADPPSGTPPSQAPVTEPEAPKGSQPPPRPPARPI